MTWGAALRGRGSGAFALYEYELDDLASFMQHRLRCDLVGSSAMDPQDFFLKIHPT